MMKTSGLLMMFTRRKVLYNLIRELGNPNNVVIQKAMFLMTRSYYEEAKLYDFFPHKRGCYSLRLSCDYHYLADNGFLNENFENEKYKVVENYTNSMDFHLDKKSLDIIRNLAEKVSSMEEEELVKYTYEQYPFFAIRSEIVSELDLGEPVLSGINNEIGRVKESEHALYTIGYEGRSIDNLINELISRNIYMLVDVRKNAYSMQHEFSGHFLKVAMEEAGISYVHCPDVGIRSDKRQELLPNGKQEELFDWYKSEVLPHSRSFVDKSYSWFKHGSIAFMCYEKDPFDCHRSRLADYCIKCEPGFSKVIHI